MTFFRLAFIALIFITSCHQTEAFSALGLQPGPTPAPANNAPAKEPPEEEQEPDLLTEFNTPDKSAAGKKYVWAGTWKFNSRYWPASIKIKMLSPTRFRFDIDAMTGANMGAISGIARIKLNKAYFDDRDSKEKDADPSGCRLLFINKIRSIELKETPEECSQYKGVGVYFSRDKFLKGSPPIIEKDFSRQEIFPNAASDKKFRALVGAADYENFLDDFHLVYKDESPNDLNAKVFIGCVRGVCPWNTAIIMLDEKGKFWAAVNVNIDDDKKDRIHYYTNDPAWTGKLPEAIQKWRQNSMSDVPVIYKNKPRPKTVGSGNRR